MTHGLENPELYYTRFYHCYCYNDKILLRILTQRFSLNFLFLRRFGRKEHESKVRLTGKDIRNGRLDAARERMGKEDGGLAGHGVDCGSGIDWDEASVVACEYGLRQRKAREGIQSLRERSNGNVVLNNCEPLTTWRPTLDRYLDSESKNACMSTRV